jgi:hypothetical protein
VKIGGHATPEFSQTFNPLLKGWFLFHLKMFFIGDMDFNVITFFELEVFNDLSR